MRKLPAINNLLLQLFNLVISAQFILLPTHTWAQTSDKHPHKLSQSVEAIRRTLDLTPDENAEVQEELAKVNQLIDGVMQNNPASFLSEQNEIIPFFDNEHIPAQMILEAGADKPLSLLADKAELPTITFDKIAPEIVENKLHLKAYNNGKLTATHIIPTLNAKTIVHDAELIIIIQESGEVVAIDKAIMVQNIFKAPFSVHTIIGKIQNWDSAKSSEIDANFLTRGTKPFLVKELKAADPKETIYLTHNLRNEVILNAGDLVISEGTDSKVILGVYSRQAIYNIIEVKTKELVALQMLYSFEGYGQTFAEKREELLQIGDHVINPAKELLELFSDDEKRAFDLKKEQLPIDQMNPIVADFLAISSRDQIKQGIKATKSLKGKSSRKVDNFTYEEWQQSYELIKEQANKEVLEINKRLALSKDFKKQKGLPSLTSTKKYNKGLSFNKANLETQIQSGDFSNITNRDGVKSVDYQQLLKAGTNQEYSFSSKLNPWYKRLTPQVMKKIGKKFLKISAYISGTLAGGVLGTNLVTDLSVGDQFKLLTDIYHQTIFPIVLDGVPYWQTAILGVSSLLAIIPISYLFGQMLPLVLEGARKLTKPGSSTHSQLKSLANTFKPISAWQTNVTIACRGYARLILPYFHKVLKVLKQPTMSVMKVGLNPFKIVEYGGKKRFLGFSPHIIAKDSAAKEKFKKIANERKKVILDISQNKKKQEILAWTLATLVVSEQDNIDPASLLGVADKSLTIENIENIHNDSKAKLKWQLTAREFLSSLNTSSQGVDLSSIPEESIKEYYLEVKKIAGRINNNSRAKNSMIKLKHSFSKMGSSTAKGISMYAVEDYEFLNNIIASPFVAEQTKREFILDHAIVATVPTFFGDRANPGTLDQERGRDIVAHNPDGFMGNSIEHNYDVFNNTLNHLLMAGPGTALVYQKVKPESTDLYNPVESYLLHPKARPEGLLKAAYTWAKGVVSFKSSNLGGYYLKSFLRRFTTLQASLTFTLVARVLIGGQTLDAAFMAYALFWFAGTLTYGWPWTIISRGNQLLEESVANSTTKLKQSRINILDGLRSNDEVLIREGYEQLQDVYFENFDSSYKVLKSELSSVAKNLKKELPLKRIKSLLKQGKDIEAYTMVAQVINQYNEKRFSDPQVVKNSYRNLVTGNADLSNLSLKEKAKLLLEESIERPPQYNKTNSLVPWTTTFLFGAVFTTILAVSLTVMSFDPSKLTVGYIAGWAGKLALFYPIVFALTSSYTWNKIGESKMYQRFKKFKSSICENHFKVKP